MFKLDIINKCYVKVDGNFLDRIVRVEGFEFCEEVGLVGVYMM